MFNRKYKEQIENMEKKISNLENDVEYAMRMLNSLTIAHMFEQEGYSYAQKNGGIVHIPRFGHDTVSPSALTAECGVVTFDEIARYVIDKKPIARQVTATKYFEHPDNTRGSAEDTTNEASPSVETV